MISKTYLCFIYLVLLASINNRAICQNEPINELLTKGVYYTFYDHPKDYHWPHSIECLYFYRDGTFCFTSKFTEQRNDTIVLTALIHNSAKYSANHFWGYYRVLTDTILCTSYIHDSQRMARIAEDWQMFITDSGQGIKVTGTVCDKCKNQYPEYGSSNTVTFQPAKEYQFVSSAVKPDSSQMWLRRRRWFQNTLNILTHQ